MVLSLYLQIGGASFVWVLRRMRVVPELKPFRQTEEEYIRLARLFR